MEPLERWQDRMWSPDSLSERIQRTSSHLQRLVFFIRNIRPKSRIHKPLVPKCEDFRVVLLHPSEHFSAPIECSLEHTAFKDDRPYEALSYVWGDPKDTASISL